MSSQLLSTSSLDDTFIIMSSPDFDSSILGQGLLPPVTNNRGQQLSKPIILDLPQGSDSSRPLTDFNQGGQNQAQLAEQASGSHSADQQAEQSTAAASGAGGSGGGGGGGDGQPPGRDGSHASQSSISSHDRTTSAESTGTTTSSSMPELVDPPPDLFSASLLFPAPGTSSPDEERKVTAGESSDAGDQHSDLSQASTAVVSETDEHGRSLRQHYGLHVIDVKNPIPEGGTTPTTTSSSGEKLGDPLDTTISTLSSFTNTSIEKSKSSDSSGHLDTSRENICDFRVSLDMFASQEDFTPSTSTPAVAGAGGDLNFTETTEADGSEFLIPPSATVGDTYSMGSESSCYVSNISDRQGFATGDSLICAPSSVVKRPLPVDATSSEPEVPPKRKQLELYLDPPISSQDLESARPSRRTAADMAMKATRGLILMKSMQKTDDVISSIVSSSDVGQRSAVLAGEADADSLRKVAITSSAGAPDEAAQVTQVEPSSTVMRQIVFDSLTSSDESSIPSSSSSNATAVAAAASAVIISASKSQPTAATTMAAPKSTSIETSKESILLETNRLRLMMDLQDQMDETCKSDAVDEIVEDTEEDDVEEDLILRYSPSQTSQSQCYPLVPETDPDSPPFMMDKHDESEAKVKMPNDFKEDLEEKQQKKKNEEESQMSSEKAKDDRAAEHETTNLVPSFELHRPPPIATSSQNDTPVAKEEIVEVDESQEAGTSRIQPPATQGGHSEDDDNPFESANFFGKHGDTQEEMSSDVKAKASDEPDGPICPVGRHKRKNVWGDQESDDGLSEFTRAYIAKKQPKLAGKTIGCQVDLVEGGGSKKDQAVKDSEDEPKATAESKAVQTVLSGEIKAAQETQRSDVDEADKPNERGDYFRRTVVVRRTITEELIHEGKVVGTEEFEEEDEPVITEYTGREVRESAIFARPTPPDKSSPGGSSSSKSASSNRSLNKSVSSSSLTSGAMADVSSLSKSTSSSKQTSSDERPVGTSAIKAGGDMRTLRSVKRRKIFEVRKSLVLSESDSTPEMAKSTETPPQPAKKMGRPRSKNRALPKKRAEGAGNGDVDAPPPLTAPTKRIVQKTTPTESPTKHSDAEPTSPSRKRKTHSSSVRVMARWRDGYYYPGLILERERDDRVTVEYDDGDIRQIKVSDVLPVAVLPVGQSVYVQSPDGYYDSSIVVDTYEDEESGDIGYVVEIDDGSKRHVIRSRVILTSDQAACMETNIGTPPTTRPGTANISLDNLVEGKRRSGPRTTPVSTASVQQPRSPRTRRTVRKMDVTAAAATAGDGEAEEESKPSSDS